RASSSNAAGESTEPYPPYSLRRSTTSRNIPPINEPFFPVTGSVYSCPDHGLTSAAVAIPPQNPYLSTKRVFTPRRPAAIAAATPEGPPPQTIKSYLFCVFIFIYAFTAQQR